MKLKCKIIGDGETGKKVVTKGVTSETLLKNFTIQYTKHARH